MIRAALLTWALASTAGAFDLALPLDCTLGESCFVQNYVDHDPGPGWSDFTCGPLGYDGHDGTDFALPSLAAMRAGVAVRAAAPGTVGGVRDGLPDDATFPQGQDCGNGVLIRHADGYETQYCHLKRGTIRVRPGDSVDSGAELGQVGLSGNTQFPHLHLSVRHDGQPIDPFAPAMTTCGGDPGPGLWRAALPYLPGGIASIGFAPDLPDFATVKAGEAMPVTTTSPALVVWALLWGTRAGDRLTLRLGGQGGEVVSQTLTLDKTQAQSFRATGKRSRSGWPAGPYSGEAVLTRNGAELDRATITLTLR